MDTGTGDHWKQFASSARARWERLSEEDLERAQENQELLVGRLKELYGMSTEEAREQIEAMRRNLQEARRGGEMYGGGEQPH